jgi:hypothetical protein
VDTLFTFPSVYTLSPRAGISCRNTDTLFSTKTFPCAPGTVPTGINCESEKCGRPASWPRSKPFFLPLDLEDPEVWLRLGAAQPTLEVVTPQKDTHLRVCLHLPHVYTLVAPPAILSPEHARHTKHGPSAHQQAQSTSADAAVAAGDA